MIFSHAFGSTAADLSAAIAISKAEAEDDAEFEFLLDSFFSIFQVPAVEAYVGNHCRVFEAVGENKLEYTTIFNGYKTLIDEQLTRVCSDLALTADRIDGFCQRCLKNTRKELQDTLIEKLLSIEDFVTFKNMMINRKAELYPRSLPSGAKTTSVVSVQDESPITISRADAVAEAMMPQDIKPQSSIAMSLAHRPQVDSFEATPLQPPSPTAGGHAAAASVQVYFRPPRADSVEASSPRPPSSHAAGENAAATAMPLAPEAKVLNESNEFHLLRGKSIVPADDTMPAFARVDFRPPQVDSLEAASLQPYSHTARVYAATLAMPLVSGAKLVDKGNELSLHGEHSAMPADDTMPACASVDFRPKPWPTEVSFTSAPVQQQPARNHEEDCRARAEYWRRQRDLILQNKQAQNHDTNAPQEAAGNKHLTSRESIAGQRLVRELSGCRGGSQEAAKESQTAEAMRRKLLLQLRSTFQV